MSANDGEDRRAQIRRERCGIGQEFLEPLAAAGHDLRVVENAERIDQARPQRSGLAPLPIFRIPADLFEARSQNRARIFLEWLALGLAHDQAIDEIQHVHDLLALGQDIFRRQFFREIKIE